MNSDRIARLIVAGVLAVVATLAVFWFLRNFELATEEQRGGWSREAIRNPLLAAEHLLGRLGVNARSIPYGELWERMPGKNDTLVVYRYQPPAGDERRQQLRDWVESGGHLIVAADRSLDAAAVSRGLLAELGVRRAKGDIAEGFETDLSIDFEGSDKPVVVSVSNLHVLEDSDDNATARIPQGEQGYGLLQYEVGQGLVTVVSDIDFLGNENIADNDHALALALLVGVPHPGTVWLAHDVVMPSLLDLAWQHLPQALAAAALSLLLWLWYLGTRLGPMLPPAQAPRRDIGEHLGATANYYWRRDRARQIYGRNRDRVLQAWLAKHYLLRTLEPAERHAWIAARSGLSARAVERALAGEFAGEADFVEMSSYLQTLRAAL